MTYDRPPYEPAQHGRATYLDVRAATFDDIERIALIDEAYGIGSVETLVPLIVASFARIAGAALPRSRSEECRPEQATRTPAWERTSG